MASYLIANTFIADDLYRKSFGMRDPCGWGGGGGGENEAGGPEKQVILFVRPKHALFII